MNTPNVLWRSNRLELGQPLEFMTISPNGRFIFLNYSTRAGPCVQVFDTIRRKVFEYVLETDFEYETGARVFSMFPANNKEALVSFFTPPNTIHLAFCQIDHNNFSIKLNSIARRFQNDPNHLLVGGCSSGAMVHLLYSNFDHFDEDDEHVLYSIDVLKRTVREWHVADFPADGACPMAVVGKTLWLLPEETIMTYDEENDHTHRNQVCAFNLTTGTFKWLPTFGSYPVAESTVTLMSCGDALWLKERKGVALWCLDLQTMCWTKQNLASSSFDPFYTSMTVDANGFGYFYRPQTAIDRTAFVVRVCLDGVASLQTLAFNTVIGASSPKYLASLLPVSIVAEYF
uniref:Uncharacterized protein n=1 Tax=Plectus sambesii TaxID=2011161 RepID=A0A914X3W7_9BILA